jgi:hypothetical protein
VSTDINSLLMDPTRMSESDLEALLEQSNEDREDDAASEEQGAAQAAEANQDDVMDGGASAAGKGASEQLGQEGQDDPQIDPSKAVVLTRDGKHEIPYSTLQQERDARKAAEQLAQQERSQREQLQVQLAELQRLASETPAQSAARKAPEAGDVISEDQLSALKEEAPELAAIMEGLIGQIGTLRERASKAEEAANQVAQREADREATSREQMVENAISNNPKLLYTRTSDPETFNGIVDIDNFVRTQPAFAGLSLEDRLAKSVAMYEASFGQIKVPGFAKAVTSRIPDTKPVRDNGLPNTLSDIPGGSLPPKSEGDALADMSAADMVEKMMGLPEKDIEKLLARVALN